MMNEHEKKIIDDSIKAYQNMIKFLRQQILDLHRRKQEASEEKCKECYTHKFKITKVESKRVDNEECEACGCSPCDCDYGTNQENYWKSWGDI